MKLFTGTEYEQMARVSKLKFSKWVVVAHYRALDVAQVLVFHLDEFAMEHPELKALCIALRHMLKFAMGISATSTSVGALQKLHEELRSFQAVAKPYYERSPVGMSFVT